MKKILPVILLAFALTTAFAYVDDALSFAQEAALPYVKKGFSVREDAWGGDLGVKEQQAMQAQLFKGNEYWFWMGTDCKGAKISVHIYDSAGKLAEDEFWQKGQKAAARIKPKRTGTYYLLVEVEKSPDERTVWSLAYGFR